MLARTNFNQYAGADFALAHAGAVKAMAKLPYRSLHRLLTAGAWLETWLRWPLRTLRMLDGVEATFEALDPDGRRFGLSREVRDRFRKNLLYDQLPDLITLLSCLDRPGFRKRALVVENEEALLRLREQSPGAIVAGFRIGAYPVVPWALAARGLDVTMIVGGSPLVDLGRGLGEKFLPKATRRVRFVSAQDATVLARGLDRLKTGGLVCTLAELSPVEFAKTTEVRFLDWSIQVPYGIAYLGAATGRSIVPAVLTREAGPRFRLRFGEPLPPPSRDRASIFEGTQQLYRALEREVLRFPEQWIGWTMLSSHMGIELDAPVTSAAPSLS